MNTSTRLQRNYLSMTQNKITNPSTPLNKSKILACTHPFVKWKNFARITKKFSHLILPFLVVTTFFVSGFIKTVDAETIELTAEKFVQLVKENAPTVQIDRIDPLIQEAMAAESDKQMYSAPLGVTYSQNNRLGDTGSDLLNFGLDWSYIFGPANTKINFGTSFNGGNTRVVNPLTGDASINTNYNSALEIGITQPLLFGGLAYFSGKRQTDIQKFVTKISRSTYNTKLSSTLQNALSVYFSYLVQQEMLSLTRSTLRESKQILAFNEKKANRSTLDRKDLLANRAQVLQSEISLTSTEKSLDALKDRLLNFLGYSNNEAAKYEIVIKDSTASVPQSYSFAKSYENALANRSELVTLQYKLAATENALKIGKAALFPKLDATLKVQMLGNGEKIGDAYSNTFSSIQDNINIEWGFNFLMYTDLLSYRVTTARSNLEKVQTLKQIAQLKEEISIAIKQSLENINTLYGDVQKRRSILTIQRERFNIAKRDFFNGKIDFSQNKSVQIDLTTANINYLSSKLQYLNALVAQQATDGTLLTNFSIAQLDTDKKVELNNASEYLKENLEN